MPLRCQHPLQQVEQLRQVFHHIGVGSLTAGILKIVGLLQNWSIVVEPLEDTKEYLVFLSQQKEPLFHGLEHHQGGPGVVPVYQTGITELVDAVCPLLPLLLILCQLHELGVCQRAIIQSDEPPQVNGLGGRTQSVPDGLQGGVQAGVSGIGGLLLGVGPPLQHVFPAGGVGGQSGGEEDGQGMAVQLLEQGLKGLSLQGQVALFLLIDVLKEFSVFAVLAI